MRRNYAVVTAIAALSLAGLTACSGGGQSSGTSSSAAGSPASSGSTAGGVVLKVASVDGLGPVLTDGQGYTLYRFDKDTNNPAKSNCTDTCAAKWPPVVSTGGAPQLTGVDPGLVGTVARPDGSQQVTVGGWPVYRFAQDTKAGDAKGQGVAGTWAAVTPTGGKATASATPTADGY
jgi:predicted lipoprotein with Yx(FWY)xxD motif